MFALILAIVTSAMISIAMRLSGQKVKNNFAMLAMGYLTSSIIAALYLQPGSLPTGAAPLAGMAAMAVVNGGFYVAGLVLMQWNIPKNGVVLTSTYMRLGLVVCMTVSVALFREIPTLPQLLGFLLALGAILLHGGGRDTARFRPGLILMMLVSGLGDTWVKLFGTALRGAGSDPFLLITFLVATLLCLGLTVSRKQKIGIWEVIFGAAVAIPNYFNSRFLLKSLEQLPGILVYPTFSVATLLTITVLGVTLFRERLSRRQWAAMGIILVALALLNL